MSYKDTGLAVILGSGLHGACRGISAEPSATFSEIPGMMESEVEGHRGEIIKGVHSNKRCLIVLGRKHHYEKADKEIKSLVEYLKKMGVDKILLTSASGSLNHALEPGDLALIEDIIDLQFRPPLFSSVMSCYQERAGSDEFETSTNDHTFGMRRERFRAELSFTLSESLINIIRKSANEANVFLKRGILASTSGPAYETRGEVEVLRRIGADLVTMSAAPEIEVARGLGMKVAVLAAVSNFATGLSGTILNHEEVLETGRCLEGCLGRLIMQMIANS